MGDALTDINRAGVALVRGQHDEAATLFAAGKRKLEKLGAALDPDDRFDFDWLSAQLAK
jgi:hypothetical protein